MRVDSGSKDTGETTTNNFARSSPLAPTAPRAYHLTLADEPQCVAHNDTHKVSRSC